MKFKCILVTDHSKFHVSNYSVSSVITIRPKILVLRADIILNFKSIVNFVGVNICLMHFLLTLV
jgi:hypothetical protein